MDITTIIEIIVALVGAIITTFVVPYIRSKTTATEQERINAIVSMAVQAAEQTIKGDGQGATRKKCVLDWLKSYGLSVEDKKLDALIESAVFRMKKGVL